MTLSTSFVFIAFSSTSWHYSNKQSEQFVDFIQFFFNNTVSTTFSTPSQTNRAPLSTLSQNLAFPLNTPISISQNNASLDSNKQSEQQIHYEETMVQQANESSNGDQQPPSAINLTVSASSDDINNANQETQNNSQESRKETIIKNMLEKRARIGSGNHNNVSIIYCLNEMFI